MKVRIKTTLSANQYYPDRHCVQIWRWWFPVWKTIYDVGCIEHARKLAHNFRNPQIEVIE